MNTALVTGGSGYFGQLLSKKLLEQGTHVRVLDLSFPGFSHPNLVFIEGTILDRNLVKQAVSGVNKVFHNAAQIPLAKNVNLFWSVNKDGTQIVADESAAERVEKLIYTSSSAVFGAPKSNPVTENTEPNPGEDYGRAKLAGEIICKKAMERHGLDVAIVRPRTILGHGRLGTVQYDATDLASLVNGGEATAVELTRLVRQAHDEVNPRINAVIEFYDDAETIAGADAGFLFVCHYFAKMTDHY
ncbi:hypothetical protein X735_32265 [Mesorhizobium sp. L2C085B000]|uniref:NAD-dependent epimerase/dehydratase family protein n=1 Tax=Mesorhizobium sp. L2C085B000 TaxID=1287117 RepID=UPI0003D028E7|nr:NAD-dependent epimerase/dehydratase family protein [Mesorhizobium sp. L2C085B000]ESZ05519.1 hypothetical protein X735_32265 [Mesorhizobium sp. L2C085B000]